MNSGLLEYRRISRPIAILTLQLDKDMKSVAVVGLSSVADFVGHVDSVILEKTKLELSPRPVDNLSLINDLRIVRERRPILWGIL